MKLKKTEFIVSVILFFLFSCRSGNPQEIRVILIDTTIQNSFSDMQITNNSSHKKGENKDSNVFIIYAKPGDEISVKGSKYKESIFKTNELSEEYNVFLEIR